MPGNFAINSLPKTTAHQLRLHLEEGRNVGADDFTLVDGAWGDGDVALVTPTLNNDSFVCAWKMGFTVPREAVVTSGLRSDEAGLSLDWSLALKLRRTGSPAVSLVIDVQVYNLSRQDGAGSNLVSSGSFDLKAASTGWLTPSFTADGSAFEPGDRLQIIARASGDDTGGSGGGEVEIEDAYFDGPYLRDC